MGLDVGLFNFSYIHIFNLLGFVDSCMTFSNLKRFWPLFIEIFSLFWFLYFSLLICFWTFPNVYNWKTEWCFTDLFIHYFTFFLFHFLLLWQDNFNNPIIKAADIFSPVPVLCCTPLVKFSIQILYFSHPEFLLISFYNFYLFINIFILLLYHLAFFQYFFFHYLCIFIMAVLKSLSSKLDVWASSSWMVSINLFFFFPLWMRKYFCFLLWLWNFLLENAHFNILVL